MKKILRECVQRYKINDFIDFFIIVVVARDVEFQQQYNFAAINRVKTDKSIQTIQQSTTV